MTLKKDISPRLKIALERLKKGEMVILVDDEDRENEGDLVLPAQFANSDNINFMIRKACGLVCLSLTPNQVDRLGLAPMAPQNQSPRQTGFTVSIEAKSGVSTGISAADRAHTIRVASQQDAKPSDVVTPGHIFPLRAAPGGVIERQGHTEGSIELCRLAGLEPAAVICEIMNEDGTMARRDDLEKFSVQYDLPIVSIAELVEELRSESHIPDGSKKKVALQFSQRSKLPTQFGEFVSESFKMNGVEHLWVQTAKLGKNPLLRIHSECLTGEAFGSLRCDCGPQLTQALREISKNEDGGIVIYLRAHEGRGIGIWNKIQAYALQDQGHDTVSANHALGFLADERNFDAAVLALQAKGISLVRLMTNNPEKEGVLLRAGVQISERVPLWPDYNIENQHYIETKIRKMSHYEIRNHRQSI